MKITREKRSPNLEKKRNEVLLEDFNLSEEVMYFRMRVIKQWGFASELTQEYKIDVNHKN